jgi:ribosomal protein L11 methyltransferase
VIVVVATDRERLSATRKRLRELGLMSTEVVEPSDARRLVLAPVDDHSAGARLVARLRGEGEIAVLRPSAEAQLRGWAAHTCPLSIGDRLTVSFVWSEHDRRGRPNVVELDPSGGFGTGQHPSTRMLLEELAARIAGGERVLDVGCGSGVLLLGALRLGASSAVGVDVEGSAVEATRRNAALNGVDGRVQAVCAPLSAVEEETFDVVVANIGRSALVELGPQLVARLSPGGWMAVSGMAATQSGVVTASLRPLQVTASRASGDWSALVLGRPPAGTRA